MTENLVIDVEYVRAGQAWPYADSFYEYIIKVNKPHQDDLVRQLCTTALRPATQTKAEWDGDGHYFDGWYTLEKLDEQTFKYLKCEPFTD